MGGLRGRRGRSLYRLALSPACWGVSDAGDWGHQIDAERVLSEAAAVGEGAITAGPPPLLPPPSGSAERVLPRPPPQAGGRPGPAPPPHPQAPRAQLSPTPRHP